MPDRRSAATTYNQKSAGRLSYSSRESQATAPGRAAAHKVTAIVLPAPGRPVTTVSGHRRVPRVISVVIRGRWIAQPGTSGTVTLDSRIGLSAGTDPGSGRAIARLAVDIATGTSPPPGRQPGPPAVRDDMVGCRAGCPPGARGRPALSPLPNAIRPGHASDDSGEIRVPATLAGAARQSTVITSRTVTATNSVHLAPGWVSSHGWRQGGRQPSRSPSSRARGDGLGPGGGIQLAVDRCQLRLDGVRGEIQLPAISGAVRCVDISGSRRSSAAVRADAPGTAEPRCWASRARSASASPTKDPQPGPKLEHLIDFPHEGPGPADVGKGDMGTDELDPGSERPGGPRVRQQGPQPLSAGEFAPRRRDIAPVQGHTGLHRADGSVLQPGPIQPRARLACQRPGPVPLVACHRHQRPLAKYPARSYRACRFPVRL